MATFPLKPEDIRLFHEQGYLAVNGVLSDDFVQRLQDEITEEIDRLATEKVREGKLSSTFEELDFSKRLARISQETDEVALSIWNAKLALPSFFDLIRHPNMIEMAEGLLDTSEIIASSVYRLRPKIPNFTYGAVPWHQDSSYMEPFCDKSLIVTMWTALVDADEDNGCLWVMPHAHKEQELLLHKPMSGLPYLEIPEENLPKIEAIPCPVKKGGVLLLTNRTPHVSFDNKTDGVRYGIDVRYQSARLPTNAIIPRLEDEMIASQEPFVPNGCYAPEPDFLVKSLKRPEHVLFDGEAFAELRKKHLHKPNTKRWVEEGRSWQDDKLFTKTNNYDTSGNRL
ncbi:hypothetical protein PROFUN_02538 [Planoprotostelium fungivorum]|uniref:Phytanoyl-CoA dioxygenase n=1 Tax=Planoprotostelium fungivorum TaxID=1890364 RepID=A0A2P6MP87_9EUKA|nr:hypothetical protein PROFUN_02538 [Planoprotostelium fungivorum]